MNDPTKRIDVEKSSLLSLKAELLRKQEEVLKNKKEVSFAVKTKFKNSLKPNGNIQKSSGAKIVEYEDSSLIAKSRKVLEAKAKYYEKMVKSKGNLSDDHCLVMFNKKTQMKEKKESSDDDDDELVDYQDCFGRSRKIPRKDLAALKKRDEELTDVAESREQQINPEKEAPRSPGELSDEDKSEGEIIGPDVGLAFQKQKEDWETQEETNKQRTSLHYQDILFDEAREHGVGFYEFSTDHFERSKQQEALSKTRDSTLNAQKNRADLKKTRDNVIANRVKAAKARVRARLGLPEEVEEEKKEDLYDITDKKKEKEEAAAKKKAEIEQEKERVRQKHIRPWDKKKLSSKHHQSSSSSSSDDEKEWKPQSEKHVMSQDEWNEKQRKERKKEFAPMNFVKSTEVFNMNDFEEPNQTLFFTSSKKKFKRRNEEVETETPRGATIPPPATFEYFGPSTTSKVQRPAPPANLEDSISAGLKFLRGQFEKGNKNKWGANDDYTS